MEYCFDCKEALSIRFSDEELKFVAQYFTYISKDTAQCKHDLPKVYDTIRWTVLWLIIAYDAHYGGLIVSEINSYDEGISFCHDADNLGCPVVG
ncbi:hypothetical protein KS4_13700 [Poriferisphaera corsica]|uniref:Uncharacterized protein n=1 Tax=Poriferisphaera corsica TaxID=2528020 RepID=A0A517YSY9_9BACT|nr:hypothetical protein KS4_13700 [Poriferisphaera corsica]